MTNLIETRPTGPAAPLPPPRPMRASRRTPAGVRVLWKVFAGLMIVVALLWGPYQVVTLLAHEERVETETFPAGGIARIEVDAASASVDIEASEGDAIEVRVEISDGLRRTGESRQVVGDTLQLRSTCPNVGSNFCWVDYHVRVPSDIELVVDSGNGSIRVTGSDAPLRLDSENGSILVAEVSGPLQLSTENGRIEGARLRSTVAAADSDNGRVQLEFVTAPSTVVATSSNGSVEVVVPPDGTAYRVDVDSRNGREVVAVPTDPAGVRSLTVRTDNGSATARAG